MKVIIPERVLTRVTETIPEREIYLEKGELILLTTSIQIDSEGRVKSATLGVVGDCSDYSIGVNNRYKLQRSERFGGVEIPLITVPSEERTHYYLTKGGQLKYITHGQDKIVRQLRRWKGFHLHAELVERIKRPYRISL